MFLRGFSHFGISVGYEAEDIWQPRDLNVNFRLQYPDRSLRKRIYEICIITNKFMLDWPKCSLRTTALLKLY
jgi:hypothetical protein